MVTVGPSTHKGAAKPWIAVDVFMYAWARKRERMFMDARSIWIGDANFPYYFGNGCLKEIGSRLNDLNADRFVVVTDDNVMELYGDQLLSAVGRRHPVTVLSHPAGESMKGLDCLSAHIDQALADGLSRQSTVVSLGGGVPGNLAGLMASLIFRGIRLVHIPTTTVAAMDSVLSLKQAINSKIGKNHLGCYYRPEAVMTDVQFFESLPARELRSGLCEMAKNCLAIDPAVIPELFAVLDSASLSDPDVLLWLLEASVGAKSRVTKNDAREKGSGLVLEYGHTVGHAIELADYRRRGKHGLSHGDSIAIGMLVAARISADRGWLTAEEVDVHHRLVGRLGVPIGALGTIEVDEVMNIVGDDNKRGYLPTSEDEFPFVLLKGLGKPAWSSGVPLVSVTKPEVYTAVSSLNDTRLVEELTKMMVAR